VGGAIGAVALGWAMDRGWRRPVLVIAYLGVAAGLYGLGVAPNSLSAACAIGLAAGVFVTGSQLILYGLASGVYATPFRGTGVGFSVALGRFGSVLGPLGAASLVAGGKSAPEVLMTLLPVVAVGAVAAIAVTFARPAVD
ncbi:MAG: 3-(3-hydroxy-phenyl)propionate transporter MhpT, partial [Caulobacteraceae bacterium]